MTEGIRTVVVDDEVPARRKVVGLLESHSDFNLVGDAGDGREAVELLRRERPAAAFLDIRMPGLSGFDVLGQLQDGERPHVVFTTAYDKYALRAFEVHATDYLLKPFDQQRFAQALDRVRAGLREKSAGDLRERLAGLLETVARKRRYRTRIGVRAGKQLRVIPVTSIDWIGAAGNYVELHVGRETHLLRESLAGLVEQLDPRYFARIHRSVVVNVDRVRTVRPWSHNDYRVVLADGGELRLSRRFRENLVDLIAPVSRSGAR